MHFFVTHRPYHPETEPVDWVGPGEKPRPGRVMIKQHRFVLHTQIDRGTRRTSSGVRLTMQITLEGTTITTQVTRTSEVTMKPKTLTVTNPRGLTLDISGNRNDLNPITPLSVPRPCCSRLPVDRPSSDPRPRKSEPHVKPLTRPKGRRQTTTGGPNTFRPKASSHIRVVRTVYVRGELVVLTGPPGTPSARLVILPMKGKVGKVLFSTRLSSERLGRYYKRETSSTDTTGPNL